MVSDPSVLLLLNCEIPCHKALFRNTSSFGNFKAQTGAWSGGACSCSFCSNYYFLFIVLFVKCFKKVQVGKDREKVQSEKDSHSKNRDGKQLN